MYIRNLIDILDITSTNSSVGDKRLLSRIGTSNWLDDISVHSSSDVTGSSDSVLLTEKHIISLPISTFTNDLGYLTGTKVTSFNTRTGVVALSKSDVEDVLIGLITSHTHNYTNNAGTVTSIGISTPTGFSVSGSPITSSGTITISFSTGYSLPSNISQSNWNTAYEWGDHSSVGYLTSYSETDPVFIASAAYSITSTNITNWNSAYSWGNHASVGYLTSYTETDPVFQISAAAGITTTNISNWNSAYSWGDHSELYSLVGHNHDGEYEPLLIRNTAFNKNFGTTADTVSEGDHTHSDLHSHTNKTILDGITSTDVSNWDTAYGWGDHSLAGYLTTVIAGGTDGYVQFNNLNSLAATTIYYNNVNGYTGLNTTSPVSLLDVRGDLTISNDASAVSTFMSLHYVASNLSGTKLEYAKALSIVRDGTTDSEDGGYIIYTRKGGALTSDLSILDGIININRLSISDNNPITWDTGVNTYIKGYITGLFANIDICTYGDINLLVDDPDSSFNIEIDNDIVAVFNSNGLGIGLAPSIANSISASGTITAGTSLTSNGTLTVSGLTTVGGHILPSTTDSYTLGSSTYKFHDLWLSTDIFIGDSLYFNNSSSPSRIYQSEGEDIEIYSNGGTVKINKAVNIQLSTIGGTLEVGTSYESVAQFNISPDMAGLRLIGMYIKCKRNEEYTLYIDVCSTPGEASSESHTSLFTTVPAYATTGNMLRYFNGVNSSTNVLSDRDIISIFCKYGSVPTEYATDVVVTLIFDI
ncbi:MAG: hypothetical protein WCX94_02680 [Candidatus Dojkabacteria bacterium]